MRAKVDLVRLDPRDVRCDATTIRLVARFCPAAFSVRQFTLGPGYSIPAGNGHFSPSNAPFATREILYVKKHGQNVARGFGKVSFFTLDCAYQFNGRFSF